MSVINTDYDLNIKLFSTKNNYYGFDLPNEIY